ncbi:MAG: hypothetical protein KDB90_17840 [Planctomycetes bacterium]|nr:hypothetical protein [Planctomycetota bacterium]
MTHNISDETLRVAARACRTNAGNLRYGGIASAAHEYDSAADEIEAILAAKPQGDDEIDKIRDSRDWYKRRVEMLQQEQTRMRDPERTLVCDILANCALLPDPNGERYGNKPQGDE